MSRYRVRQSEVTPYSPANHTGTKNFRLIATSPRAKVLVIDAPPCGEDPQKVIR